MPSGARIALRARPYSPSITRTGPSSARSGAMYWLSGGASSRQRGARPRAGTRAADRPRAARRRATRRYRPSSIRARLRRLPSFRWCPRRPSRRSGRSSGSRCRSAGECRRALARVRDFGAIQEYERLDQFADIRGADEARDRAVPAAAVLNTMRAGGLTAAAADVQRVAHRRSWSETPVFGLLISSPPGVGTSMGAS